jgi:pimeloyl-ACP methyl ester carboxylesterase
MLATVHWLDRYAAIRLARTPPRRRVFRDGWGDPDVLAWYRSVAGYLPAVPEIDPIVTPSAARNGLIVSDLVFESPVSLLPPASRLARARLISPHPEPERICLLMAAWNDHGYATRGKLARLLNSAGVAAVILENPLYGGRRSDIEDDLPLATASDFMLMGRSAVEEGRALLGHFLREGRQVAVSGFSMGGNLAAFVGATVPFPVAIAPIAASHSPGPPFVHGAVAGAVHWDALGGNTPETRRDLLGFLLTASVLHFEAPEHTGAAVLVGGTIDGYVPTSAVQALHRHWPGSRMDWVHAGHATLLLQKKPRVVQAIIDAYQRLDAMAHSR